MPTPEITVLMPVYNGEKYVEEAIGSIIGQTFRNFIFLIIDDCSNDSTLKLLKKWQNIDPRIKIIANSTRLGVTKSLNIGLTECKTELVARQDADDFSFPRRLQLQMDYFKRDHQLLVLGTNGLYGETLSSATNTVLPTDFRDCRNFLLTQGNILLHGSTVLRIPPLLSIGGYDEYFSTTQDYDLWLRASEIGKVCNIPETLYFLRKHDAQISIKSQTQQLNMAILAQKLAWQRIEKGKDELKRFWAGSSHPPPAIDNQSLAILKNIDPQFLKTMPHPAGKLILECFKYFSKIGYLEKSTRLHSFIKFFAKLGVFMIDENNTNVQEIPNIIIFEDKSHLCYQNLRKNYPNSILLPLDLVQKTDFSLSQFLKNENVIRWEEYASNEAILWYRLIKHMACNLKQKGLDTSPIALYGAGEHTRHIIPILEEEKIKISLIIDDTPQKSNIKGHKIISPTNLPVPSTIATIIVSSDAQHSIIYHKALKIGSNLTVIDPYDGLPDISFLK